MTAITLPFPGGTDRVRVARHRRLPAAVYWRRRAAVLLAVVGGALAASAGLGVLGGGPLTAAEAPSSGAATPVVEIDVAPVAQRTHVVRPGDTLWSIARALQPSGDVRPLVDALAAQRDGRPLQPGERIALP